MTRFLTSSIGAACILIAVGALTYGGGLSGRFIFDDRDSIVVNESIRELWPPLWLTDSPSQLSVSGRPVVAFSLALNYAFGELDVRGYHVFNQTVHIISALILFGIVGRTLRSKSLDDQFGKNSRAIALVTSLVWLVHPLQTEGVYYIIQRTESLMGMFYLLCLYCAIRASGSSRPLCWVISAVVACAFGMASKESMVTAPLVVMLYDSVFKTKPYGHVLRQRRLLYAGLAATWGLLAVFMLAGPRSATVGSGLGVGSIQYAMNQCVVLVKYLALVFWPHPLSVDYGDPVAVPLVDVLLGGGVVTVLLIATVIALKHRPAVGFLGAWFFLILGPTSSFVPIITEAGAERRMYLPLAAIVVIVVIAAYRLIHRIGAMRSKGAPQVPGQRNAVGVYTTLAVVVVGLLGWTSYVRSEDYSSQVATWSAVVRACPKNPRAHCNLATELSAKERIDEAIHHYEEAVRLKPGFAEAHYYYGMMLKHGGDAAAAMRQFLEAVRAAPRFADAHYELGNALKANGELDQSYKHYRLTLEGNPGHVNAHINLGNILRSQNRHDEAVAHYRAALAVNPDNALAHLNLGNILLEMGRAAEGLASLKDALQARPNWSSPMNRLAWVMATHPDAGVRDATQAVAYARRAAELTHSQRPIILDTLAAAYANAGQFEQAEQACLSGIALFSGRATNRVRAMRERLRLYRQRLPYREPIGVP